MLPDFRRGLKEGLRLTPIAWNLLFTPAEHPLFELTRRKPVVRRVHWHVIILVSVIFISIGVCTAQTLVKRISSNVLYLLLMGLVACSSVYVVLWMIQITTVIRQVQRNQVYDLFCVLPSGAQGADLAISAGCIHRHDALAWIDLLRKAFSVFCLAIFAIVLLSITFNLSSLDIVQLLSMILDMILLVSISYIEHVQSVVCGTLLAIWHVHLSKTQALSELGAVGSFLAIQIMSLLLTLLIASGMNSNDGRGDAAGIGSYAAGLLVFYLSRNMVIAVLWQQLQRYWHR